MIATRADFIAIMVYEGGIDEGALFMPETDPFLNPDHTKPPAHWFINTKPIDLNEGRKGTFFNWCKENLKGSIFCYYSQGLEEWWGFTEKDDISVWLLKWG